ncbi:MAG: 3-hydroxyacyl-CoA dehydrogenase/enoyl-CoA hydratase family protein [Actinomycetota bacterium]
MTHDIRSVAVLGAGTMGAAIAAHAANAGLAVDLLDLDQEATQGGFDRMLAARPAALASPRLAERIRLGTFEEDLDRVGDADWVVEAIVERLEPKQELLARVEKLVDPDAVVTSNTSGLPLASLAEGRSEAFRRRFLGTHFFNPPRYLKLVELIPTADTDPEVLERMRAFVERVLGKGAVVAKDTPNFIANRLGSFAGMHDVRYALEHGYSIEEVDALTGPLVGRPKTATFRLFDQVGLDVMVGVAANLYDLAPEDESRDVLPAPEPLRRMLDAKLLGNKTGGGFYRRGKRDGQTVFDVLDLDTLEYRPAARPDLPIVAAARDHDDLGARLGFLLDKAEEDRGARYLRDTLLPSLAYAARRVPEIADSLVEVDHAVEWGFGYELGPFRAWDAIGVADGVARMEALGIEVPAWVKEMLAAGHQSFYRDGQVYSPLVGAYQPVPADQEVIDLDRLKAEGAEVAGNGSASLVDLGDGVLCLELHAPASAIDAAVVELGARAAKEMEGGDWKGLVIASQARNFCVGANLGEVGMAAYQGLYDQVGEAAKGLQDTLMSLRYAPRPVVAAPHGQTLGGGAEIVLAADRVVAALETYIGLVEVGVGIVPAGGGCKELLRRVVSPAMRAAPDAPPLPFVQRVFETIGLAKVATSAVEARELGFLEEHDVIVLDADHQLAAARREVLDLADAYQPPAREDATVYAAGRPVLAALELAVQTLQWAGQAGPHDGVVARQLARVLCGGELSLGQWVPEQHILDLEREAFLALLREPKTMERIQAFLTTGKVVRN